MLPGIDVRSDGLACFAGVIDAGCAHSYIVVGTRKPRELPQFTWVNTVLGNLKTMVNGACSCSSKRRTSAAGTVEPPEQMPCTCDRSVAAKLGCSVMATSMVGTPTMALPL